MQKAAIFIILYRNKSIGSRDKKFYAINPDGTLKWSYETGDKIECSPAIDSDGTVYIGSFDDKLYAFGPGAEPTPTPTPTPTPGPVGVPEFNAMGLVALVGVLSVLLAVTTVGRKRRE